MVRGAPRARRPAAQGRCADDWGLLQEEAARRALHLLRTTVQLAQRGLAQGGLEKVCSQGTRKQIEAWPSDQTRKRQGRKGREKGLGLAGGSMLLRDWHTFLGCFELYASEHQLHLVQQARTTAAWLTLE